MFESSFLKWNDLDVICLLNDQTGDKMMIVPGFGATLLELVLSEKTIIKVGEQFPESYRFESAILSPFPNKIRDGVYHFAGGKYELEKNDAIKKNAAHGLL